MSKIIFPKYFIMANEIFSIAAVFWILIPIGLIGGALLLKYQGD